MRKLVLSNNLFELRQGEVVTIVGEVPSRGRWFAVMIQPTFFPDGPRQLNRDSDGAPIEQAAILTCEQGKHGWQWMQLAPQTKEHIGDLLFDANADRSRWYYVVIE